MLLDSGSKGLGLSPDRVIALCSWAKHFTLAVPLSTQKYKWVPANCQGNLTNWTSIPSKRSGGVGDGTTGCLIEVAPEKKNVKHGQVFSLLKYKYKEM